MSRVPRPQGPWLAYWILVFGVLAFAVPEAIAVSNDEPGDALSQSVAWVADVVPFGRVVLVLFLAALGWHFTIGRGVSWWPRRRRRD